MAAADASAADSQLSAVRDFDALPTSLNFLFGPKRHSQSRFEVGKELVDLREYVRNNAGKAFEFMLEVVEEDRKAAGLPDIATARAEAAEDPEVGRWLVAWSCGAGGGGSCAQSCPRVE